MSTLEHIHHKAWPRSLVCLNNSLSSYMNNVITVAVCPERSLLMLEYRLGYTKVSLPCASNPCIQWHRQFLSYTRPVSHLTLWQETRPRSPGYQTELPYCVPNDCSQQQKHCSTNRWFRRAFGHKKVLKLSIPIYCHGCTVWFWACTHAQ